MRFLPAKILALAACASPALAYIANVFTCIDPSASCCDFVTTTGIGANCVNANLENVYQMLQIDTLEDTYLDHELSSPYVSACYVGMNMALKGHEVAACCDSLPSDISPSLKAFNCLPPEQALFTYDSIRREVLPFGEGGVLNADHPDDDDDDYDWLSVAQ